MTAVDQPTIILTAHARERCVEMGITVEDVETVVRHYTIRRPARRNAFAMSAESRPDIVAIVAADLSPDGREIVITVVPRTYERYTR